jgi:hypothetical protein
MLHRTKVHLDPVARSAFERLRSRFPSARRAGAEIGVTADVIVQLDNDGHVVPATARRVTEALMAWRWT